MFTLNTLIHYLKKPKIRDFTAGTQHDIKSDVAICNIFTFVWRCDVVHPSGNDTFFVTLFGTSCSNTYPTNSFSLVMLYNV